MFLIAVGTPGQGRGVRWHDKPRGLLWLCAFDDAHDRGYEHAERLQQSRALYPDIEQHAASPASALLPWGTHADEDAHEWARAIYGALETWETSSAKLAGGETISYPAALYFELSKDTDEIWTLVIRRRLAYPHTVADQRERWLTNGEIHALFRHLAGQPDENDYEFENPPHPQAFIFAQVHFLNGTISPAAWREFAYRIAVTRLQGDTGAWEKDPTIASNLSGCSVGFLPLEEMWATMLAELTTTPASSEVGRLAQLLKAAGLTAPEMVARPAGPAPRPPGAPTASPTCLRSPSCASPRTGSRSPCEAAVS